MTTDLCMISIMVFENRTCNGTDRHAHYPKPFLRLSLTNRGSKKPYICTVPLFKNAKSPFQRLFTLSARDYEVRRLESMTYWKHLDLVSLSIRVCVPIHERVCLSSRVWEIMEQQDGQNQRSIQEGRERKRERWGVWVKVERNSMLCRVHRVGAVIWETSQPVSQPLTVWSGWGAT